MSDPHEDFMAWDAKQVHALSKYPVCCLCNKPIQTDYLYDFFDALYCEECMEKNYRKPIDYYIKED